MASLRDDILKLEAELCEKKKLLYLHRLSNIINIDVISNPNIKDLIISADKEKKIWQISYTHYTEKYNSYYYATEESDNEEYPVKYTERESKISFGKFKGYFIKGGVKLNIYKNASRELRIINPDYEFDLDIDEQLNLARGYSENKNLPECLAIKFLLYMSDNNWDDDDIITHFSVI